MKTLEYCVALKRRLNITSDYELAKRLGVSKTTISNYTTGRRAFDVSIAARVAEMLELDPMKVIADMELERGTNDALWSRIAKKVALVMLTTAAGGQLVTPAPAEAAILHKQNCSVELRERFDGNTHCTFCAFAERALAWLDGLTRRVRLLAVC